MFLFYFKIYIYICVCINAVAAPHITQGVQMNPMTLKKKKKKKKKNKTKMSPQLKIGYIINQLVIYKQS